MADIIILLVLASIVGFIIYRQVKNRGKGCGSCTGCGLADSCPSNELNQ